VQQIIPPVAAGEEGAVGDLGFADGPRLQVEHLLERGRRHLAFAGSADARIADLVAQRRELARQTLLAQTSAGFVAEATITEETAADQLRAWMDEGVDGVVAYNDDIAGLVLSSALRAGIAVPERLAIVGHDDTPLARLLFPGLSTVRVDNAGLGRFLAELALSAATGSAPPLAGPETDARLVVRETT
jgi:DNA-binding LacI/PurR family transcriptional regulator